MERWDNQITNELLEAVCSLRTKSETKRFLRDLLTADEIIEFGKRWRAARMLQKNIPYTNIIAETGLSSTTVARVSQWLHNGMGGYRLVINRLKTSHHPTHLSVLKGPR